MNIINTIQGASAPTHDARAFDPAIWVQVFEAAGGAWAGPKERTSFFCTLYGRSRSKQLECNRLLALLGDDPAKFAAVVDWLSEREGAGAPDTDSS